MSSTQSSFFIDGPSFVVPSLLLLARKVLPNYTKLVAEILELHSRERLGQYINNLLISTHILELYSSLLYHIPYIKFWISICFDLSWNTRFSVIFIQLWLSQIITVVSNTMPNNPNISFQSHIASQQAEKAAMYFSLAVLRATLDCFLLNHEIMADPIP